MEHFYDALTEGKADAALAASLFHYKELEIREVKEYLRGRRSIRSVRMNKDKRKKDREKMAAINNDWLDALKGEFKKPYYKKLFETVNEEYRTRQIFPPADDIFNAFHLTPLHNVKAVILGQDPYHNKDRHTDFAFL